MTEPEFDQLLREGAVKLEITGGVPTWEASPGSRHQWVIDRIRAALRPISDSKTECECAHLSDVLIHFKDGSFKRPDIAIFCSAPPIQDEALTVVPQAVIEVISPGYEYKDIVLNPQFYLAQDVDDVLIVDPRADLVTHYRTSGVVTYHAPVTINLECGCECTVPQASKTS